MIDKLFKFFQIMDYELFKLHHRGMDCLGVKLNREDSRNNLIRKIKGVKWSSTHRCWYVTGEAMDELKGIFETTIGPGAVEGVEVATKVAAIVFPKESKITEIEKTEPALPFVPSIDQLSDLKVFKSYMEVNRFRENTITNYGKAILKFLNYFKDRNWRELTPDEIHKFQYDEIIVKELSFAYQSILISAIKKFYLANTGSPFEVNFIKRPRRPKPLPKVLSKEQIQEMIKLIENQKHRTMLSLTYACGLRAGELLKLKPVDILAPRGILLIKDAKGSKDRQVPLSGKIVEVLNSYLNNYKPNVWLFEGQFAGEQYSKRSLQQVFKDAVTRAGLDLSLTIHCLRHSFATHIMEGGVNLRVIQELLGHKNSKTTEIYTHVSTLEIKKVKSPFDDLDI